MAAGLHLEGSSAGGAAAAAVRTASMHHSRLLLAPFVVSAMATCIAVRGCSASLSVARQARRSPVVRAAVPTRNMFGGLFGGKSDKKEVRRLAPTREVLPAVASGAGDGSGRWRPSEVVWCSAGSNAGELIVHPHLAAQGKNDGVLQWARSAKRGTELAPTSPPEGLEIATVAGAL